MKIVAIADTHCKHNKITTPKCDVLIHAGDFSAMGRHREVKRFLNWFNKQPATHKILIAGNHDLGFEDQPKLFESFIPRGITYLKDSGITIDNVQFYGMPWQPEFFSWAFNANETLRKEKCALIPPDTEVLITHGAPYNILDWSKQGQEHTGCKILRDTIESMSWLKLHIFGHIHEGYGSHGHYSDGPYFINASICDLNYQPVNLPVEIEL